MLKKPFPYPNASLNENVNQLNIFGIDVDQSAIYADCVNLDEEEKETVIARNNWFWYKGTKKNVPFTLTTAEINQLKNPMDSNNES